MDFENTNSHKLKGGGSGNFWPSLTKVDEWGSSRLWHYETYNVEPFFIAREMTVAYQGWFGQIL